MYIHVVGKVHSCCIVVGLLKYHPSNFRLKDVAFRGVKDMIFRIHMLRWNLQQMLYFTGGGI